MKAFTGFLCATALTALMAGGCTSAGHYRTASLQPGIMLDGPRQVSVGEQERLVAHTQDTAGARGVQWTVEPSTARITPENNTAGQTAMFSANQRGRYIITARVDMGNGQAPVEKSTTIDVVGGGAMVNERMPEPRTNEPRNEPAPARP